jgi:uncharacterized membrane protein
MDATALYNFGIAFIFISMTIFLVPLLLCISTSREGKMNGGEVVIIGFILIVVGTDKESVRKILLFSLLLSIVLTIMMILYNLALR